MGNPEGYAARNELGTPNRFHVTSVGTCAAKLSCRHSNGAYRLSLGQATRDKGYTYDHLRAIITPAQSPHRIAHQGIKTAHPLGRHRGTQMHHVLARRLPPSPSTLGTQNRTLPRLLSLTHQMR